ncbi:MAG TPA: folylpolyglutamate synthase/dihydrofolate synthase family protein [Candidatus Tectomicrobia bacterium]
MAPALTYDEALAYLKQFINYESRPRVPYDGEHFNLSAFEDFLQSLDAPHRAFPSVLIAGSKGKGSTAAMVASMLSQAGLRTGLFTKPHLVTIRERTQIDRQPISRADFAAIVTVLRTQVEAGPPRARRFRTFFELTTALSFLYFARQGVDIAVVEVGLGGRLDTTNVLTPQVAVLTPIGLEHTHILGDTLAAIAGEKAGIVKPQSRVVSAPQAPEVVEVFEKRCQSQHATLFLAERDFQWQVVDSSSAGNRLHFTGCGEHLADLYVPLPGHHQAANAAVALTVAMQLRQQGWPLQEQHLRQGLATVHWEGRLEILNRTPWVVLDAAHTIESARCLHEALAALFPHERLLLVIGMATDKKAPDIVATLAPLVHEAIVTRFSSPRAYNTQRLADEFHRHGVPTHLAPDPVAALTLARSHARPADLVCVTGSVLLLGELKARLQGLELEF